MSTTKERDSLAYIPITGAGVDALDRRKEHNDSEQETATKLQNSINKVKDRVFQAIKNLTVAAAARAR